MIDWRPVRWEGGPHDGSVQQFGWDGRELPEWRVCECHGVAYRFAGVVDGVRLLVVSIDEAPVLDTYLVESA